MTEKLWTSLKPIPMTPITRTVMAQDGIIHSLMINMNVNKFMHHNIL